jgi:hypothetical protein
MSPGRTDELSYGDERPAAPWPRGWLVITAVVAVAALAAGLQLGRRGKQQPPGAAPVATTVTVTTSATATSNASPAASPAATSSPTTSESPSPAPTAFTGPQLTDDIDGEVLLGGRTPSLLDLGSGRTRPVVGLPAGAELMAAVGTDVGVIVLTVADRDGRQGPQYVLPHGSTRLRRLPGAAATWLMEGSTRSTYWVFRERPAEQSPTTSPRLTGEERHADGRVVRRVTLPEGAHPLGAAGRQLLIGAPDGANGPSRITLWDPETGRARLRLPREAQSVAQSRTAVAWIGRGCTVVKMTCVMHVTSLPDGADTVVELTDGVGYSGAYGRFTSSGEALALALGTEQSFERERRHAYAVTVESGSSSRLRDGAFPSGSGWVVGWTPGDTAAVLADAGEAGVRIAVWRRAGEGVEAVGGLRPGASALAVRPG